MNNKISTLLAAMVLLVFWLVGTLNIPGCAAEGQSSENPPRTGGAGMRSK
ncbi:hypothetical protein ES703_30152 [subsurface metagenome]